MAFTRILCVENGHPFKFAPELLILLLGSHELGSFLNTGSQKIPIQSLWKRKFRKKSATFFSESTWGPKIFDPYLSHYSYLFLFLFSSTVQPTPALVLKDRPANQNRPYHCSVGRSLYRTAFPLFSTFCFLSCPHVPLLFLLLPLPKKNFCKFFIK